MNLGYAEERVVFHPWHNVDVLCWVAYIVVEFVNAIASSNVPLGMWKVLLNHCPVGTKACLFLSFMVPTLDVAAVLATTEGMDPSFTPARNCCSVMV